MQFLHDGGETEALTGDQIADEVASLAATDPTLAMCNSYHDASVSDIVCFYLGVTKQTDLWKECVRCVERVRAAVLSVTVCGSMWQVVVHKGCNAR